MKIKNLIFTIFIIFVTAMVSIFVYDLLNNLNTDVLVNITNQDNIVTNNQVYVRDLETVNKITSTSASNNTFPALNDGIKDPWAIAIITFAGIAVIFLATGSIVSSLYLYKLLHNQSNTENIEMVILN